MSGEPPDGQGALPPASDEPPRQQSGWKAALAVVVGVFAVLGVVALVVGGVCALLLTGSRG